LTARRGGPATPRHANGAASPGAESSLFSSPAPRRGLFEIFGRK